MGYDPSFPQILQGKSLVAVQMEGPMRTLLYIFAICLAALLLFVTVNRLERNRPLAILLMVLILGTTAAAIFRHLMP